MVGSGKGIDITEDRMGAGMEGGGGRDVMPALALATASIMEAPPSVNCCVPTTAMTS